MTPPNFPVRMEDVFPKAGNAIQKMIVVMVQMKEISAVSNT